MSKSSLQNQPSKSKTVVNGPDFSCSGRNLTDVLDLLPDDLPSFQLESLTPARYNCFSTEHGDALISKPVSKDRNILATHRIQSTRKRKRSISELDDACYQSYQGVHTQPCKNKSPHPCGPEHVRFEPRLKQNSKQLNLGQYDLAEEAADVYLIACFYYNRLEAAKQNTLQTLLGPLLPPLGSFEDDKRKEEWVKKKAEGFLEAYASPSSASRKARRKRRTDGVPVIQPCSSGAFSVENPVSSGAPGDGFVQSDLNPEDISDFHYSGIGQAGTTSHQLQGDLQDRMAGPELPATGALPGLECRDRSSTDYTTHTGPVTTNLETRVPTSLALPPITSPPLEDLGVVLGSNVQTTPPADRPMDESINLTEQQSVVVNGHPSNLQRASNLRFTPPILSALNEITEQRWELSISDSTTVILVPKLEEGFSTKLVMTSTMVSCFEEILKQGREISLEFTNNGGKFPVTAKTLSTCADVLQQGLKPLSLEVPK